MFTPRGASGSARRHTARTGGRKSVSTPSGLLFSPRRAPLTPSRATPTRVQSCGAVDSCHYDVQPFGSSLPVKVMEVLTTAEADEQISVKVDRSGWAWLVCGERLIIWKISQTPVAKLSVCKDLQLAPSDYAYTADLIAVNSSSPLESASVQCVCVMAASPDGPVRFWPSLAHEGTYVETPADPGGHPRDHVAAVRGGSFIVSSYRGHLLRAGPDGSGRLYQRPVQQGHGVLSGIGRRVSSLFGLRNPPADATVHGVLYAPHSGALYTLGTCGLNKWEVGDATEVQVLSWNACPVLADSISDAIWGSESNYGEIKEGVNVAYLDMQLSHAGLVVLAAAWHPADTPCLAYFCLVTIPDAVGPATEELPVEVTRYNPPFQTEDELHKTRMVLPSETGPAAYLYNEELVYACTTGAGRSGLPEEKLSFNFPSDRIHGAGVCADWPLFFSRLNGLVAVVARESASILPETVEDSLCTSVAGAGPEGTPPKLERVADEDKTKQLKRAFLQFCRNDRVGAQNMADRLFPHDAEEGREGAELDGVVARIDLDLVDDYPASDPRWAESVPDESAGFTLTSLILLHQLEDKMKAHHCFMDFLLQISNQNEPRVQRRAVKTEPQSCCRSASPKTGLLDHLSSTAVRSSPMATRLLLCEHAEKLSAAFTLKNHHAKQPELVNAAITATLKKNGTPLPASLSPADVFFREVSQISSILESLLDEEEKCLKENPAASVQWAEVVLDVNGIIKDMLQAAVQYRETKASLYRPAENAPAEPEYVPWTASGGVRTAISRQHELILHAVYPQADSGLRGALSEQLVALLDSLFGGYVAQLASLRRPGQRERRDALEMEYTRRRAELLTPLLELGQHQWAAALAEKYCDFDVLVRICERTDDPGRLQHYMSKFAHQNFADFLFRWYMEKGKRGKLLSQPVAQHEQLTSFLQAHQHLSWLHHIHVQDFQSAHHTLYSQANAEQRYFSKKKTLLALSKLTALASSMPEALQHKQVNDIVEQERFLLHQETLPKQLLEEKQQNPEIMPVLGARNLIELYICDENRGANEYDFKKALDLLQYVDKDDAVDIDALKRLVFSKALKKDWKENWSASDGSDDPLEAAKDSIFVKILQKLVQEGVPLQSYLPDVKDLLQMDELDFLRSKSFFEFLLRANYEHYVQSQI
ncbi:nuclear pore complex protein Nup133 isoform X2 [Trichomycterus rosablanca]|uniref:nuclear pore complex protein Nup133 isoform X2 n=1 Tax=Trichomycterus rosablanca TaxID=2290929 RepID=UPI002F3508F3